MQAMGIHVHGVDKPATPQEILNKVILVVAAIYGFFFARGEEEDQEDRGQVFHGDKLVIIPRRPLNP